MAGMESLSDPAWQERVLRDLGEEDANPRVTDPELSSTDSDTLRLLQNQALDVGDRDTADEIEEILKERVI